MEGLGSWVLRFMAGISLTCSKSKSNGAGASGSSFGSCQIARYGCSKASSTVVRCAGSNAKSCSRRSNANVNTTQERTLRIRIVEDMIERNLWHEWKITDVILSLPLVYFHGDAIPSANLSSTKFPH
jgi:hypothetical protein